MADDPKKDKDIEEVSDDQEQEKKGGGKLKFILIPVILLVQLGAAYHIVFNMMLKPPEEVKETKPPKEKKAVGQFYEINDIVVNPAESGGRRYLVAEIGLETNDENLVAEATSKEIWIRDAILSLLGNKTAEELMEVTTRKKLKKEILDLLNKQMDEGKFERLYFKKYLIQ